MQTNQCDLQIVVIAHHPMWREAIGMMLHQRGVGSVVASTGLAGEALTIVAEHRPDVVVMDMELADGDGLAVTTQLRAHHTSCPVLILSGDAGPSTVRQAQHAGADGLVGKTESSDALVRAVVALSRGRQTFPEQRPSADHMRPRFSTEDRGWTVSFEQRSCSLPNLKGVGYIAELVANEGRWISAIALASPGGGRSSGDDGHRGEGLRLGSDASGPILDATAKRAYRTRIRELQQRIDEASGLADPVVAVKARTELEALEDAMRAALGLGGRDRRPPSDSERARVAVTRSIRRAILKIREPHRPLAHHLQTSVKTGTECIYAPQDQAC